MSVDRKPSTMTSERVYQDIRSRIVSGGLSPGSRLVQRQLAAEYNTSSSPIIECIRRLERDGLVENIPGLGAEVREFSQHDLFFVCRLRETVEATSAALYAVNASRLQRVELEKIAAKCDEAYLAGDEAAYYEADVALHLHIARHSGSPLLCHFVESSYIISATIGNRLLPPGIRFREHNDLVAAVNSGDPKRARKAAVEHLRTAFESVTELSGLSYLEDIQ